MTQARSLKNVRSRRGQSFIELVLLLPFLLVILLAVIQITQIIEVYTTITRMASDSAILWARRDTKDKTDVEIIAIVRDSLKESRVDIDAITVKASTRTDPNDATLEQRRIYIEYSVQPIVPLEFMGTTIFDTTIRISSLGTACTES